MALTKEEKKWLINNYEKRSTKELAETLGLTKKGVYTAAFRLGLSKTLKYTKGNVWSSEETDTLVENHSLSKEELYKLLPDRSKWAIYSKLRELKSLNRI